MLNSFNDLISRSIQRWPVIREDEKNDPLRKLLRRAARQAYCFFFLFARDRRKVNATFWGGDGGFLHATRKFDLDDEEWKVTYENFAGEILKNRKPGMRVLELGCSAGQWCRRLNLSTDGFFVGVDINAKTIDFAKQKFADENAAFFAADLIDFDKYDGADIVMVCQTFFFLDYETLLSVLKRIPKGALLVMQEPVNPNFKDQKSSVAIKYSLKNVGTGFSHNYPEILKTQGYEILDEKVLEKGAADKRKLLLTAHKN